MSDETMQKQVFYPKERWPIGRRNHKRKTCMIPVDYVINRRAYRDFIENISRNGVFINTRQIVAVGSEIVLTFAWQHSEKPVKSRGIITRKDAKGFAVYFSEPVSAL